MPQASDSNYIALTRHRRPFSTAGRPPVLEIVDDAWATEAILPDDDLMITRYEQAVSSNLLLFAEDEIDGGDHTNVPVVTPIVAHNGGNGSSGSGMGGSGNTGNPMLDRRRREEMWNDLGLDQLISAVDLAHFTSTTTSTTNAAAAGTSTQQRHSNQNQSQTQTPTR